MLSGSDSYSQLPPMDAYASPKARHTSGVTFSSSYSLPSVSSKPQQITEDIDGVVWLTELGLEQYIETFLANLSSDGHIVLRRRLKQIRQQDLSKMNITDFEHQKFIMDHIRLVLKHPFNSLLHKKESKMISSPMKPSPARKTIKPSTPVKDSTATHLAAADAKTSEHAAHDSKKHTDHHVIAKDVRTQLKEKAKASRRRKSFDNNVWQSISSLRTKEKQHAVAAAHLRDGIFNDSPHHNEVKNVAKAKQTGGRRRWSFSDQDNHEVKNVHDKGTVYGNIALEYDMLQSSLKHLEQEYLSKLCSTINCEKASIFFVNEDTGDLLLFADNRTWYRLSKGSGLAGFCAETGQSLNIADAYTDYRFNKNVDKKTGFHTRNVLCQPVRRSRGGGSIVAVVEMMNKRDGSFGEDDEEVLAVFVQRVADLLSSQFSDLQLCAKKFAAGAIYVANKGGSALRDNSDTYSEQTEASAQKSNDRHFKSEEMMQRDLRSDSKEKFRDLRSESKENFIDLRSESKEIFRSESKDSRR